MPTISAGASATITLPAGRTFAYSGGSGSVLVYGPDPAAGQPYALQSVGTLGPFGEGRQLYVSAATAVTYSTDGPVTDAGLTAAQIEAGATRVIGANASEDLVLPGGSLRITTPAYTWATLPAASAYIGNALVTGVGLHGSLWRSDGSTWGLVGGSCVIAESAVAQTATTGTTSAVDRVTVAIPANLMGLNGTLEIVARWTVTNNANAKTATILFGGSTVSSLGLASNATSSLQALLSNRNSASSQIGGNNNQVMSLSASAWNTLAIDTTVAQNLVLREQLAVGTDSIQIQSYSVRLYRA